MIIIKNITAIQLFPPDILRDVDIVIDENIIVDIGERVSDNYKDYVYKKIDGSSLIVCPGFVCAHNHLYSTLSRGIIAKNISGADFITTLKHLWWRLDRSLDEESIYYSALLGCIEAIRTGTTAIIDHHSSPNYINGSLDIIEQAYKKTGLRGILCYEITNRNAGIKEVNNGLNENIRYIKKLDALKEKDGLFEAAIGGHASFTMHDNALGLIKETMEETKRGIHMHVAEDSYDVSYTHHYYNKDIVERLSDFGLLNNKAILAHGVHLSRPEIQLLNKSNCFIVHNARSNMNNGVGYIKFLSDVNNVALGTDGITSDMPEELKFAYFKQRDAKGFLSTDYFLKALNNGNNILENYFNRPFGKIEKNAIADLTILNYNPPTPITKENLASHIIFGISSCHIQTVIVNGNIVMENKVLPFDLEDIYIKGRTVAKKLWQICDNL